MTPASRIEPRAWMTRPQTQAVMAALANAGATARFVGGCVRDTLMGRPAGDTDIATDAEPEAVVAALQRARIKAVPTGIAHGTITAVIDHAHFEITTLRRDVETFGRHARVAFTDDWAADATRRDFTMNALFLDLEGNVYDPVHGLDDVKRGRVRFVGDPAQRIDEDVLRLLRYFRFFAWFDRVPPDADALAACRAAAPKLPTLSGERVRMELLKLFAAPNPGPAVDLMMETGVLAQILPEATVRGRFAALLAVEREAGAQSDPLRRIAALIEVNEAGALAAARRLRFSSKEATRLAALAAPSLAVASNMDRASLDQVLYRLGSRPVRDLAVLAWAEARARSAADDQGFRRLIAAADGWRPVVFPLKGADALASGVSPGPAVGRLMALVEEWWIEQGFVPDRAQCLARLRELSSTVMEAS
jgi:poly(A) polymerase